MKTAISTLTTVFLAASAGAAEPAANSPAADKAETLVQAMEIDKFYLAGLAVTLQKDVRNGEGTQAQVDCILSSDFGFVRAAYADQVRRSLTSAEIEEALQFYQSSTGQLTLAASWQMIRDGNPGLKGVSDRTFRKPTDEEVEQLLRFRATPVSAKVDAVGKVKDLGVNVSNQLYSVFLLCGKQP